MAFIFVPNSVRTAQAIGITTSIFASGIGFTSSWLLMPALLQTTSAPLLTRQWRQTFRRGAKTVVPMAVTSGLAYLYLAYRWYAVPRHLGTNLGTTNLVAGLLMLASGAYTQLVMGDTNRKLLDMASELEAYAEGKGKEAVKGESAHELVDRWTTLNAGRAAIFAVAGLAGTLSALF